MGPGMPRGCREFAEAPPWARCSPRASGAPSPGRGDGGSLSQERQIGRQVGAVSRRKGGRLSIGRGEQRGPPPSGAAMISTSSGPTNSAWPGLQRKYRRSSTFPSFWLWLRLLSSASPTTVCPSLAKSAGPTYITVPVRCPTATRSPTYTGSLLRVPESCGRLGAGLSGRQHRTAGGACGRRPPRSRQK